VHNAQKVIYQAGVYFFNQYILHMNWFPNHAVSVYLTSMYLLHYNICKKPATPVK